MLRAFGIAAVAAAVLGVAACAGPEIPFDRSTATGIKTIGVLAPDIPAKPTVRLASDVGQSFGLVGGLIDAAMESNRDDKFCAVLVQRNFLVGTTLSQDLLSSLKTRGYDVKPVPVTRPGTGFLKVYPPAAETGADAYLDVSAVGIGYGYIAAGIGASQPYRPYVWLDCKLVRASDASVLMQDRVMYNPIGEPSRQVTISPDPAYQFPDFDSLMAGSDKAVAGIEAALKQGAVLYRIFQLPVSPDPLIVTVASEPFGSFILLPHILLLDTQGNVKREFTREDVLLRNSTLSARFRSHSDESYLAVESDPVVAGSSVSRVAESTNMYVGSTGTGFFEVHTGNDKTI